MQLGYAPGVWDMLHVGHVRFLERACELVDKLVVGVPSDDVVLQDKGNPPVVCLEHRIEVLDGLWSVDVAIPYHELEFIPHLEMLQPDVLFVGEDWGSESRHLQAELWVAKHDCRIIKLPYTQGVSSTDIKVSAAESTTEPKKLRTMHDARN